MKRLGLIPGIALFLFLIPFAVSCGDEVRDYGICTSVEYARCALRTRCLPGFDYDTCEAYYAEYCRTRHVDGETGADPTPAQLAACVAAIGAMDCATLAAAMTAGIDETDLLEACSFAHPKPIPDAGAVDTDTGTDVPDAG
jgi:hypothetical protein